METTTSFDLNQAIQHWRENLAQSPAFGRENLDELESHLRDSVASLQKGGLGADEAFLIATKRMGKTDGLNSEFGKVNRKSVWLDRALWMLVGIQCWSLVHGVVGSVMSSAVSFGLMGYDFAAHGRAFPIALFGFAYILGFTLSLAVCWWLISRRGSGIGEWVTMFLRRRPVWYLVLAGSCGILLLSFWMNYGITILQLKFTDIHKFGEITMSRHYTWIAGSVVQTITFVILTILIAQKCLRTRRA